ncbi:DUF4180 domain-containing protein [Peptostreptococcus anaerobius]|uniref:DUF4180 domain-containing protein n=1 Tax=Peptostreptococcus porci TaxID=2652282 RepID=A0A6N7XAC0_9FIRM|nr:DUF4180 domain-containing protein [Peptostreptococcus porci]MDY4560124.1 DUF4180 domain-containing protein [Peptostreptococcus porci]MST61606.1 DUF4180 domain-containing protein [Peptostreptococcus porci]
MKYRILTLDDKTGVVRIEDESVMISDEQSFLDVFMTVYYETGENRFIIGKDNLTEDFFNLSNKIAGSILQKVINYKMKLAIIGDFSKYESNALKNFMYECNEGNDIFFVDSEDSALKKLNMNSK